jgi:hypothetical protein
VATSCNVLTCATLCGALAACATHSPPPCAPVRPSQTQIGAPPLHEVVFRNELTSWLRLTRAHFSLDGVVVFNAQSSETRSLPCEISLVAGALPPGDHVLQVLLQLRGHGEGPLSYLRGYRFEVKSSHSFTVKENQAFRLEAIAWEKGTTQTPLEQRPAIRYVIHVLHSP